MPAKRATALLPVVQACAVVPLGKARRHTPSRNSVRATFIPNPARDMLSFRSIAKKAEASCKRRNVNPTGYQNATSAPTTTFPPSPLAIADTRNASGVGGRAHRVMRNASGLGGRSHPLPGRVRAGRGCVGQGWGGAGWGGAVHPTSCGGL